MIQQKDVWEEIAKDFQFDKQTKSKQIKNSVYWNILQNVAPFHELKCHFNIESGETLARAPSQKCPRKDLLNIKMKQFCVS